MGPRPEGMSIDRIDNNGNYTADNCRWATCAEQSRNTRNNKLITLNGETKCFIDWCEYFNFNKKRIDSRLRLGWSNEEAFEIVERPPQEHKGNYKYITMGDKTLCLREWCSELNLSYGTVTSRMGIGWSLDQALELIDPPKNNHRYFTINGVTKRMFAWCKESSLSQSTVDCRLRRGWTIEEALGLKARKSNKYFYVTINNVTKRLGEWCKEYNFDYDTAHNRICNCNWTPEEALELVPRKKKNKS